MTILRTTPALDGLTRDDRRSFCRFGSGAEAVPGYERIQMAFEHWAKRSPDAPALEHGGERLSYAELDRRANCLASLLRVHGVGSGDRVGLFLHRSIPMVIGILATLKIGATYVPQDTRITPREHLRHIMDTARRGVVLTLAEYVDRIPSNDRQMVIALDNLALDALKCDGSIALPTEAPDATDVAVVIFTSGTTGRPNGVAVTHSNLCNMLLTGPGSLGIGPGMRVAQLLNIAFDMAVWEIFGALSHGGTLVIRGSSIQETVSQVDVVIATPSILGSLDVDRCRNISIVAVAGERCPLPLAESWSAFTDFHNSCGPTEVTIVNTIQRYAHGSGQLTIGRPLPNTTVYVLDEKLQPVRIGEVGEMWAGGACVTAGYLDNEALTAQRYLPDPFLCAGYRMFRTRDLGRWTATGELEHHGRTDDQVKVNGFRIELDSITTALERVPGCAQAMTLAHDGDLIAFVTPESVDREAARREVERRLPYYCIPSEVIGMSQLPRTPRGKVDTALLRQGLDQAQMAAVA